MEMMPNIFSGLTGGDWVEDECNWIQAALVLLSYKLSRSDVSCGGMLSPFKCPILAHKSLFQQYISVHTNDQCMIPIVNVKAFELCKTIYKVGIQTIRPLIVIRRMFHDITSRVLYAPPHCERIWIWKNRRIRWALHRTPVPLLHKWKAALSRDTT